MDTCSYYDDLRATETGNFTPIFGGNYVGRNLHRYNGDEVDVVMCHVPVFMRYTQMNGDGKLMEVSELGYGASAATLLAINHWNNGNGVVVKEIEGVNDSCKIRLTTEMFDTQVSICTLFEFASRPISNFNHYYITFSLLMHFTNFRLQQSRL